MEVENDETSFEEMLAIINGDDSEQAKKEYQLRQRIYQQSEKYVDSPVENWPEIKFNWDTSIASQRYSLDGVSENDFQKYYPKGFLLGYVLLPEFDKKLCHFSRRDEGELWELGFPSALAFLIVYLSEFRPISPPLVKPVENNEVILGGGHHRYAIAKAIGVQYFPIHVPPEHKHQIEELFKVAWKVPT